MPQGESTQVVSPSKDANASYRGHGLLGEKRPPAGNSTTTAPPVPNDPAGIVRGSSSRNAAARNTAGGLIYNQQSKDVGSNILEEFELFFGTVEETQRGFNVDLFNGSIPPKSGGSGLKDVRDSESRMLLDNVQQFLATEEGRDHQSYLFFRHKHTLSRLSNLHLKISYEDLRCIMHCVRWQQQSLQRLWDLETVVVPPEPKLVSNRIIVGGQPSMSPTARRNGGRVGSANDQSSMGLSARPGGVTGTTGTAQTDAHARQVVDQQQPSSPSGLSATIPVDQYRSWDLRCRGASLELLNDVGQDVAYPFFRLELTRFRGVSEHMSFFDRSLFKSRTVLRTNRDMFGDLYAEYFNPIAV
ncbi:unnamed protein product, partial [Amoebophrya sp. A25]|eukprot:GSA25T00027262001.1